ncbi:MAG: ankyrin repeat domain-containing protein [Gammaproteobacteria bacterium]
MVKHHSLLLLGRVWIILVMIILVHGCASTAPVGEEAADSGFLAIPSTAGTERAATPVLASTPAQEDETDSEGLDLILAARYGHDNVVRILLNRGVDIDRQDELGNSALIAVAAEPHTAILKLLLKRGADVHLATNDGTTALMNAAASGRLAHVRLLLRADADMERRNHRGETALVYAVKFGQGGVLNYLLAQGADPNLYSQDTLKAHDGQTPLMYAAQYGALQGANPTMVRSLLAHGADPTLVRNNGDTALTIASRNGYQAIVDLLRQAGARDERPYASLSAEDALLKAIKLNDTGKVQELLETAADPNYRDTLSGTTPLLAAAYYGNVAVIRALIEHDAEIDNIPWGLREERINASSVPVQERDLMRAAARGDSALITAIRQEHSEVAQLLLEAGANALLPNRHAETPGLFAARKGNTAIMRALLARGLDPDLAQSDQLLDYFISNIVKKEKLRALLIEAASNGHAETSAALLEAGANPDVRDEEGRTALFWAASQGFAGTVNVLLEYEANADIKDDNGMTPLMSAAKSGLRRVVSSLLAHQAAVNIREDNEQSQEDEGNGMTALAYAVRGGHTDIVHLLLEQGADPLLRDAAGMTALDIARQNGYGDIVQLLDRQLAASPF